VVVDEKVVVMDKEVGVMDAEVEVHFRFICPFSGLDIATDNWQKQELCSCSYPYTKIPVSTFPFPRWYC